MLKIIFLLALNFYFIFAIYRCKTFRNTWDAYDNDGKYYFAYVDISVIPAGAGSYNVLFHNFTGNSSGYFEVFDEGSNDFDYFGDGTFGKYCDAGSFANCNLTLNDCTLPCTNVPYTGFVLSFNYVDKTVCNEICVAGFTPFLVYNNFTYNGFLFAMFTPDHPDIIIDEDISDGYLRQACKEWDVIPDPVSDMTCSNFVSNTVVKYTDGSTLFNITLNVAVDDSTNFVTLSMVNNTINAIDSYIHIDSGNNFYDDDYNFTKDVTTFNMAYNLNTQYVQLSSFVDFRLDFHDNAHGLTADIKPIEFYSINNLRIKTDFTPFTQSSPSQSPTLGPIDNGLSVTSTFTCTNFVKYVPPATTTPGPTRSGPTTCPTGWYNSVVNPKKCVRMLNNATTWDDGNSACSSLAQGATLLTISNAFENGEVNGVFADDYKDLCPKSYIGYRYDGSKWTWAGNETSTYVFWDDFDGYPLPPSNNPCGNMIFKDVATNTEYNGVWQNEPCNKTECSFCQLYLS